MANTIQHKRGTAAEWTSADPTLAAGEFGYETDTGKLKLGDGSTAWSALGYFEAAAAAAYSFQGSAFGYASGGTPKVNTIQKYSFTADENATDVGDLTQLKFSISGNTSSSHGYTAGGRLPTQTNVIEKFPFAVDENATDVGDLTVDKYNTAGSSSSANGYQSGGATPTQLNVIEKFPFAADENGTDIADLLAARSSSAGISAPEYAYVVGGFNPSVPSLHVNVIQKFPFAVDENSTDVGNLTVARSYSFAPNSTEYGYTAGGLNVPFAVPPGATNTIDKFPFAADANATDVGDLVQAVKYSGAPSSSTTDGYGAGGVNSSLLNTIQKFPFATDANATDIADLLATGYGQAGSQN